VEIVTKSKKVIEDYWLRKLSGDIPKITLPMLSTDACNENVEKKHLQVDIPGTISRSLIKISKESDMGLFLFFLSGLYIAFNKYTGIRDLVLGSVTPGRKKSKINWYF
jgi:surfactin family lipopeptide synthetase A